MRKLTIKIEQTENGWIIEDSIEFSSNMKYVFTDRDDMRREVSRQIDLFLLENDTVKKYA